MDPCSMILFPYNIGTNSFLNVQYATILFPDVPNLTTIPVQIQLENIENSKRHDFLSVELYLLTNWPIYDFLKSISWIEFWHTNFWQMY